MGPVSAAPLAAPEVPLSAAKGLALKLARETFADPAIASVQLYRDLEDAPAVWVFELRGAGDDTPLTVVAAARRGYPPLVMHWRGQPWHRDPEFLARAAARVGAAAAKASDWSDLRFEGPFDLWVPRPDAAQQTIFAGVHSNTELTKADVQVAAPSRHALVATSTSSYLANLWTQVDRSAELPQIPGHPSAASPQYGSTRYISRVPYLYQGQSPDCGIVSMMDILLYHDASGFPSLVDENDLTGLRQRLRTLMKWTNDGSYMNDNFTGVQTYVGERGVAGFSFSYVARGNYRGATATNLSFTDVTSEIDAGRPFQLMVVNYHKTNVTDQDYGNHFVCGVGYYSGSVAGISYSSWVIVHDNWLGSFTNPYTNPNDPYVDFSQAIGLIKVRPPASAPPVAATAVAIDAPTNSSTLNAGTAANFLARVIPPTGVTVSRVEFRAAGVLLRTATTPDAGTATIYSTAWTPSVAGSTSLAVTAVDSLGRSVTATNTVTVTTVNQPPVIGWSSPQFDNTQILANNALDLSVTATDSDGTVSSVEFVSLGTPAVSLGRVTPSGATFTTLRGVVFPTAGDYTLRAIATDNRGATAMADRRVRVVAAASANNDAFANAAVLPGAGDSTIVTTSSRATRETGEPYHAGSLGGHSLWWRWTPSTTGTAVITTRGTSFDTVLAVYTGNSLGALTEIVSNDDDGYYLNSFVRFTAQAGVTYQIAVDGYANTSGDVVLNLLHASGAAPNDNFAARTTLTGSAATVVANSIVATREAGEPLHLGTGGQSLWWTWTAPDDGTLNLSTVGSTFDTVLVVYTGNSLASLSRVAADDDSGADLTSTLSMTVTRGTVYQIAVDGYSGDSGSVRLSLGFLASGARPANDNFANRAALSGNLVSIAANSLGGTKETGEPNHAGSLGGSSLWWTWTAPADGNVTISTEGSSFDTVLAVYTGAALSSLSVVASDDDSGEGSTSRLAFAARSGVIYQIAVDGYARSAGSIALYLTFVSGGTVPPVIAAQPQNRSASAGGAVTLSVTTDAGAAVQWKRNGTSIAGANSANYSIGNLQPGSAGIYIADVSNAAGTVSSSPAVVGLVSTAKVLGNGSEIAANILHPSGNTYDQVLLSGTSAAITADARQVTRVSFLDLTDDIVQVEFSGAGVLSLLVDGATGPALPTKYVQSVNYMRGHAGIVITGADETTNVSVFSVGRANAVNQALFRSDVTYDGFADLAFIAITSANGRFGGVRAANGSFFATKGMVGLYAPGVQFTGPVFIGDISASADATPMIRIGSGSDVRINGGDLLQANNRAVQVSGITQLRFVAGTTSQGTNLPAQTNRARLEENGVDVTSRIVVNP